MPAQSGNTDVLQRMRRNYSREAYLQLVDNIRAKIPDMTFSSDFIAGFCGETDEQFQDTLTLIEKVKYEIVNISFLYVIIIPAHIKGVLICLFIEREDSCSSEPD